MKKRLLLFLFLPLLLKPPHESNGLYFFLTLHARFLLPNLSPDPLNDFLNSEPKYHFDCPEKSNLINFTVITSTICTNEILAAFSVFPILVRLGIALFNVNSATTYSWPSSNCLSSHSCRCQQLRSPPSRICFRHPLKASSARILPNRLGDGFWRTLLAMPKLCLVRFRDRSRGQLLMGPEKAGVPPGLC